MKKFYIVAMTLFVLGSLNFQNAFAESKEEIDIKVKGALERFKSEVVGGEEFLSRAKGVLIFPNIIKAGFVFGGEYGEGAMQIKGETVEYYNAGGISFGFQIGAQSKTVILVFLDEQALSTFRASSGWKAGVDGSVAIVKWGVGGDINTVDIKDPVVGFIFGNKGLMYNLTLEGSKFTKIVR